MRATEFPIDEMPGLQCLAEPELPEPTRRQPPDPVLDDPVRCAERLRQEKFAAEQASATKSARLSRTSHEMRTPLNAVMGLSQLLLMAEDEPLTEHQRERLQWVLDAARRLHEIADDLLDVACDGSTLA